MIDTLSDSYTQLGMITVMPELADTSVAVLEPVEEQIYVPPPLSREEDTFALAVVECAGNISAAYKMTFGADSYMPLARGKELLSKPGVALRIKKITDAVAEASLISVGSHLDQLAKIRDLSLVTGQLKTAYMAERSRGEAVGIYQKHDAKNHGNNTAVQINLTMASKHDENI